MLAFVVLANVVPHLDSHRGVPAGVDNAVNSYYTDLELGDAPGAAQLICSAQRSDWSNGGQGSDLNLDPTTHTIASTSAAGGGKYTVDVNIVAPGRQNATLTVVKQDGAYLICGGTGP